jgi:hypothetical protein
VEALAIVPDDLHVLRTKVVRACAGAESLLGEQEQAGLLLRGAFESLPDQGSAEGVVLMTELAQNCLWRARYANCTSGRASGGRGETARRSAADRGGPCCAGTRRFDDGRGRACRSQSFGSRGSRRLDVGRRSRARHSGRGLARRRGALPRSLRRGDAHANRALAVARATGQGEHSPRPGRRRSAVSGGSAASWRRPASCSTAASRQRALLGNTHALGVESLAASAAALRAGTSSSRCATARRRRPQRGRREGLPLGRGSRDLAAALLETGEPSVP